MHDTVIAADSGTQTSSPDATPASAPVLALTCLTIAECTPVAEQIRQHLQRHERLTLSLSQCEEIDTAGLQLLAILRCDEETANRIDFDDAHDAVLMGLQRLGLSRALGFPAPAPVA